MLKSLQQHPLYPFSWCCTRGACYATSPQSDAKGSLEGEASGGWVLQAQMARLLELFLDHKQLKQNKFQMQRLLLYFCTCFFILRHYSKTQEIKTF